MLPGGTGKNQVTVLQPRAPDYYFLIFLFRYSALSAFFPLMIYRNISLVLEYDGSNYGIAGSASARKDYSRGIRRNRKEILREEISRFRPDRCWSACSRAVVSFFTSFSGGRGHKKAFNALLPSDIRVINVLEAPLLFILENCYRQELCLCFPLVHPPPVFWKPFVYSFSSSNFDLDRVRECLSLLEGTHDFTSFSSSGEADFSPIRTIHSLQIEEGSSGLLRLWVEGEGFLYNMVRIIAGELWKVGVGKKSPREIKLMLEKPSRSLSRLTLPSRGLFLIQVFYPPVLTLIKI